MFVTDKAAFLEQAKKRVSALSTILPDSEPFNFIYARFSEHIRDLPEGRFRGNDYEIMDSLRIDCLSQRTETALFSSAFIDIWFFSNFTATTWCELVRLNPEHIAFAIHHAYSVFAFSGADSSTELAHLISVTGSASPAKACLKRLSSYDALSAHWAKHLLLNQS